jgi:hypothetical protein
MYCVTQSEKDRGYLVPQVRIFVRQVCTRPPRFERRDNVSMHNHPFRTAAAAEKFYDRAVEN